MGLLLVPSQFNTQPAFPTALSNARWNPVVCINPSLPLELINGGAIVTTGSAYASNSFGVARAPTSAYVSEDYVVSVPALVDFTTYLYVYYYTAALGGYVYMTGNGSGAFAICGTHPSTSGNWGMYCGSAFVSSGEVMPQKQWTLLTITRSNGTVRLYRDGVLKNTVTNSTAVSAFTRFTFNSYITSGGYGADTGTQYGLAGIDTVAWSADEIAAVSSNPWAIFQAPDEEIYISAVGGGSTGTAAGISAAVAVGASNSASVGTSAGIAAASGTGASRFSGVGTSSGIASAPGIGAANFSGVGSAAGIASAAAVGAIAGSSGTASGIASANAAGSSTAASVGSANGIAAASGIGSSQAASIGSAAGIAAASGVGDYISAGSTTGTAAATSSASGVGASNAASIGSSSGVATASGVSIGGAQVGGHYAGVAYTRKPKPRKHEKDDEIRQALLKEIEGEQEEIIQSAAPVEIKKQAAAIVQPYVAEAESADIATLQQDLTRIRQLLADYQREVDEDEELLLFFH